MRFITALKENRVFIGVIDEGMKRIVDLSRGVEEVGFGRSSLPETLIQCIELGDEFLTLAKEIEQYSIQHESLSFVYDFSSIKLLAPIPRPLKNIFCVGKNYAEHAIEMGSKEDIPEYLMMFTKAPTTVIGPNESVMLHDEITNQLDYEGELAIVIGKKGRGISEADALDYVFGYTIVNDITARDLQNRHKQFFIGKSLDTTCPMGPYIAHKSLISNPNNLTIETKVSGEVRQSGNTEQFIFNVQNVISTISAGMTLEPGDIIATGTPAGVGKGFKPPRFLKKGDIVEVSVEGLGKLINTIGE